MADYKLGVDSNQNYKLYTVDNGGELTPIATITGLQTELTSGADPVDASTVGVTVASVAGEDNKYTVTVSSAALADTPDTNTQVVSVTASNGGSFTLALGSGVQKASTTYTAAPGTVSSAKAIVITANHTAGWFVDSESNSLKYTNGISNNTSTINVTGALNLNISANDYVFDAETKTITLKKSAFVSEPTDTTSQVTISNTDFKLLLSTDGTDAVDVAGTLADTAFSWDIKGIKEDGTTAATTDANIVTKTATLQKDVADGWKETATQQTYTYQKKNTYVYATITGLNKDTTAANLPTLTKDADVTNTTAYDLKLVKANFPTTDKSAVTLTNGSAFTNDSNTSVTPNFQLAKGADISADPSTKANGEITLKIGEKASADAKVVDATVNQHLNEGWTVDNEQASKTITYYTAKDVTLATIKNLAADVTTSTAVLKKSDKTITLNKGSLLADANNTVTLTQTAEDTLKESLSTYVAADGQYTLELGNVDKGQNVVVEGLYDLSVSGNKAFVKKTNEQYWTLGEENSVAKTKVTYTARAAGKIVAELEGLGDGAKYTEGASDNTVAFDTTSTTITLSKAALKTSETATVDTDKVQFNEIGGANYEIDDNYTIALASDTKDVLAGATHEVPKIDETVSEDGTAKITAKPSIGWQMDENNKTLSYVQPENVTVATISNLKASTTTNGNVTIDATAKTITLKQDILQDVSTDEKKTEAVSNHITLKNEKVKGYTDYVYKLALGSTVTKYNAGTKTPTLTVVEGTTSGKKAAQITVTEEAGWVIDDNALKISYKKDKPIVVAKVDGLAEGAATTGNVIFNGSAQSTAADYKVIKLKKDALVSGDSASDYTITLERTDTADAGGYDTDYVLALDTDVVAPGASYIDAAISVAPASMNADDKEPANTYTAKITGKLAEGWTINSDETDATKKNLTVTYTAAKANSVLAKITGLALNATAGTDNDKSVILDAGNKTVTLTQDAFRFADDGSDADGTAAAGDAVLLTNEADAAKFSLKLKKDSDTSITKFGGGATCGWAVDGTTAYYNQGTAESWTLDTAADSATKGTKVTYTAAIANNNNEKAKHLITIANLGSGLKVGKKDSESGTAEDSAVGTTVNDTFTPGLYISKAYTAATPESKGELTLNRNVLGTAATVSIAGDDAAKYIFTLGGDNNPDTYVPTTKDKKKYTWSFNSSTGVANYYESTANYWTLNEAKTSLSYTAETPATTLATITGLKKELYAVNASEFDKTKTIADSYISTSENGTDKVVEITTAYTPDDTATEANETVIGKITLSAGALDSKNVTLSKGSDKYDLVLNATGAGKVTAPVYSGQAWAVNGTTATYSTKVTTAGYLLNNADKSVGYVAATNGDTKITLATITGLKSGLTSQSGAAPTGIILTGNNIQLSGDALGTTDVTLTNSNNANYKLTLADTVIDSKDDEVKNGMDVWRLNKTTATYRHITPAYYTLATDGSSVTYTKEDDDKKTTAQMNAALYATVEGLKSGLTVGSSGADKVDDVLKSGSDTVVSVTKYTPASEGVTESVGVVTVKQGALDAKALNLTASGSTKYKFVLDGVTAPGLVSGTAAWTVSRGTATLTGNTQAGYALASDDKLTTINYYAAQTGRKLATLTGLNTDVQASKLTAPAAAETNTAFELTAAMLTNTDAVLTNETLPDGTALTYTIKFKDVSSTNQNAIDGDNRWYFKDSALTYGKVHDAHYEDSETEGIYKGDSTGNKTINATTIKYVSEIKDTAEFAIKNLASGVDLTDSDNDGYYKDSEGSTPVTYKDSADTEQTEGIKLSGKAVTVKRAVLSLDPSKPTEIVNNESFETGERYKMTGDGTVPTNTTSKEMLTFENGKLTYYKGKSDRFTSAAGDTGTKLVYVKAEDANDDNTIATVSGLKSDLKLSDDGTKLISGAADAVTRNDMAFTIEKVALDSSASKKVAVTTGDAVTASATLTLGTSVTNDDKPKEGYSWVVSGTTATYNQGKTAGWELVDDSEDTDNGNIVYREAHYTTDLDKTGGDKVLFTLKDLKSGLKVDTVKTGVTNKDGSYADKEDIAALVDNKGNVAVAIDDKAITFTSYAFNKKDVLFKDSDNSTKDYTLAVYDNPKTTTKKDNKGNDVTEHVDGYVAGTTATGAWAKAADTKATYTVTITEGYDVDNTAESLTAEETTAGKTPSYDQRVVYTKAGKTTATLTGINASATLTGITVSDNGQNQEGTITVPTSVLNKASVKLANSGSKYTLLLGDNTNYEDGKVWNISKGGTATYVQKYKANSYVQNGEYDITYSEAAKEVPLVVVTGLDKTLDATEAGKGVSDTDAATKYGIKAESKTRTVTAETDGGGAQATQNTTESYTEITLSDRTKLAAGDVKLQSKDGGKYEFAVTSSEQDDPTSAVNTNLGTIKYKEDAPLWSYSKGTVTLATGDSGSWAVKQTKGADTTTDTSDDEYDYTVLTYTKPDMKTVATISGLNTSLALNGNAVKSTTTTTTNGTTTTTIGSQVITLGTVTEGAAIPIQIDKQALVADPKNNAKVTLKLANKNQYALATSATPENQAAKPEKQDAVWSISKGTATYQYDTTAGWTFADDGTTVTYTTQFTTGLAKISGLNKDLTTIVTDKDGKVTSSTKSPGDTIVSDKTTNVTYSSIIEVNDNLETDAGGKLTTFTLKNADYLAGSKVTISAIDKKSGTTYQLFADENLKSKTYEAEWEVKGTKGTATLAAGTKAGYDNPKEGDKAYGTTVTYVPSKASTVLATVTGLKKDTSTTADNQKLETLIAGSALTADTLTKTISLTNDAILDKSTVTLGGKGGYSFDLSGLTSSTKIDTDNEPKLKAKSGTVTLVEVAEKDKFSLSSDGKKLVYNTKDTETVLATVKGLNKTLVNSDGKIGSKVVTSTTTGKGKDAVTTPGTTEVVSYDKESGVITLNDAALAKANVTFTLGKGVTKGDYTLALNSDVMTESGDYQDKTGWTITNGTASYKNYDMGYYKETSKGYTYVKESKGDTYATISGLKKDFTDASKLNASDGLYSTITITKDMLDSKNVTLKNLTPNKSTGISGAFTLKLNTDGLTLSTLTGHEWNKGNLTATQTAGYKQATDTSITYLKAEKKNQAVASLSGINKNSSIAYNGATINLTKDNLTNANIVLTTKGLDDVDYKIVLPTGTTAPATKAKNSSEPWTAGKNKTETFTGSVTEGYTLSKSGKSVTYTKAVDEKKTKALVTVKGVEEADMSGSTASEIKITGGSPTLSSGLLPVTYSGNGTIVGSKDADSITVTSTGITVNPGKGDDYIVLGNGGKDTILYGNGDGNDVIDNFDENDTIKLTGGKLTSVKVSDSNAIVTVGKQTIQLTGAGNKEIHIVDKKGDPLWSTTPTSSSDVLLADDNYSMDAASLSDITEPFKASYTPYDFEAGLDLVKQNSFTPALTFTGTSDKK